MVDTYEIQNVSFGDLKQEAIHDILKDGRLASHFLERQLEIWYPHLTFVDGRGYDHVDEEGNLYDQKCFTKGGLAFAPSNMIGGSRSINEEVATEHCKDITYIACDIHDNHCELNLKFHSENNLVLDLQFNTYIHILVILTI